METPRSPTTSSPSPQLSGDDLHHVLSLLARLGASSEPVAVRKRLFAEGLAQLIGADIWVWTRGQGDTPCLPPPSPASLFGGGWKDNRQPDRLHQALSHRGWRDRCRAGDPPGQRIRL